MTEIYSKMCRICLTTHRDDNVSDSSTYANFFIELISLKNFSEQLWLCLWCKASLKRAIAVLTLILELEKVQQNEIPQSSCKRLYELKYVHTPHIDIPPVTIDDKDNKNDKITNFIEEFIDPLNNSQNEDEITLKRNKKQLNNDMNLNEETNNISNLEDDISLHKNKIESRAKFKFDELKFQVEYLNLEEQVKEVEMKKLKYKDFEFQCNECGMGYLTSDVFEDHKMRHLEFTGPHKCSICGLRFKSQDVLSQHTLAHKRRFKCVLCNGIFKRWSHCIAHRHKCGGVVEPTACGICDKIFTNEYCLKIHMKVHKSEKKYSCAECDRRFASKQRLTVHLRSHSGIKPFPCDVCGRSFATHSNMRAHFSTHTLTNQYYCVECHVYYKTAKSLKRHFRESVKHVAEKSDRYSCKDCSKQFSTEKSLNNHMNARHGTEHRCTQCEKTFSNKSNLNKHMKCIHSSK